MLLPSKFPPRNLAHLQAFGRLSAAFLCVIILCAPSALAAPEISFKHTPPTEAQLGIPGTPVTLTTTIPQTKDISAPLKLVAVKDGRLMEVPATKTLVNDMDQAVYQVTLFSPMAELSYQFLLFQPDGTVASSGRYLLRRTCIPVIDGDDIEIPVNATGRERVDLLVNKSRALEAELKAYDEAARLADEIKALIDK